MNIANYKQKINGANYGPSVKTEIDVQQLLSCNLEIQTLLTNLLFLTERYNHGNAKPCRF